jgi:hypothetical protein
MNKKPMEEFVNIVLTHSSKMTSMNEPASTPPSFQPSHPPYLIVDSGASSFAFNIADSLKITSLEMRNLEDSGHNNLYPSHFRDSQEKHISLTQ